MLIKEIFDRQREKFEKIKLENSELILKAENEHLNTENKRLKEEIDELKAENVALNRMFLDRFYEENKSLEFEVEKLNFFKEQALKTGRENLQLKEEIENLKKVNAELEKFVNQVNSANSTLHGENELQRHTINALRNVNSDLATAAIKPEYKCNTCKDPHGIITIEMPCGVRFVDKFIRCPDCSRDKK
jgi:RNase P subunit RPR2